jgi:uncharacterized damage-inducible protein DinB
MADTDDIDEQGRPLPPLAASELDTLVGFLEFQRATLEWKVDGLDAAGMLATTAASTMTLGGIVKHMALVENIWFWRWLHGHERPAPWNAVDWDAEPDWEFESSVHDSPEELLALWRGAVDESRRLVAEAVEQGGLDRLAVRTYPDGQAPSLRWILVHMIEEYARHNGHADLLREAFDGQHSGE